MTADNGPVLPWARTAQELVGKEEGEDDAAEAGLRKRIAIESLGLKLGDRIEVRWFLESDGPEGPVGVHKWWGATIMTASSAPNPEPEGPLYTLRYDAHEDFEEEESEVGMLETGYLFDVKTASEMRWRREGEEGSDGEESTEEEEEGEEEPAGMDSNTILSTDQLASLVSDESGEAAALAELSTLPMAVQTRVAAGFRDFADHFREFVEQRAAGAGPGDSYVVTEGDVSEFMVQFNAQRKRTA